MVWTKSAENLGATPYDRDLSIEITFSHTNLAGQSLQVTITWRHVLVRYLNILWLVKNGRFVRVKMQPPSPPPGDGVSKVAPARI
jgi:hypothetical protein